MPQEAVDPGMSSNSPCRAGPIEARPGEPERDVITFVPFSPQKAKQAIVLSYGQALCVFLSSFSNTGRSCLSDHWITKVLPLTKDHPTWCGATV